MEHFVTFVLDRSGSMEIRRQETVSGFNDWMKTMETFPGDVIFSLLQFDSVGIDFLHKHRLLTSVDPLRLTEEIYVPRQWTPLYDAIGKAIIETSKHLEGEENDVSVLIVIMTDGMENWSKEWSLQSIQDLIKSKTEEGWTFTYLGAGPEAWSGGETLGFFAGNILNYAGTPQEQTRSMDAHAGATMSYLTGMSSGGLSAGQPVSDFYVMEEEEDGGENTGEVE